MAQALNSGSNFALTVAAGRLLGAGGLGSVALAFTTYLIALGFQRALVTEPLLAKPHLPVRRATALSCLFGTASGLLVAGVGVTVTLFRDSLLSVAPWLPPLLLQDFWRSVLIRDGKAPRAAIADGVWLLVTGVALLAVAPVASVGTVIAAWSAGGFISALSAWSMAHGGWPQVAGSLTWWRENLAGLGAWLWVESLTYQLGTWLTTALVAAWFGLPALGGIRAVQSIFAPLSVVGQAVAVQATPAVARGIAVAPARARREARRASLVSLSLSSAYLAAAVAVPDALTLVFGRSFAPFRSMILPLALAQLPAAVSVGLTSLLKATGSGRALTVLTVARVIGLLAVTVVMRDRGALALLWAWLAIALGLLPIQLSVAARSLVVRGRGRSLVVTIPSLGAGLRYWRGLLDAMSREGVDVQVATLAPPFNDQAPRVHPVRLGPAARLLQRWCWNRGIYWVDPRLPLAAVRLSTGDILTLEYGMATGLLVLFGRFAGRRVWIFHEHARRNRWRIQRWMCRFLGSLAEGVIANTETAWRQATGEYGLDPLRVHHVPLLVPPDRASLLRDPLPLPLPHATASARFLFVGRLVPGKGVDILLRAAAAAAEGGRGFTVWIAGAGPEYHHLRELARNLGLGDVVTFLGAVPYGSVGHLYEAADALVLPTRYDYRAMVVLEALRFGLPVITTSADGNAQTTIRTGENGIVVPAGEVEPLAEALRLMASDPEMRARLRRGASSTQIPTPEEAVGALLDVLTAADVPRRGTHPVATE